MRQKKSSKLVCNARQANGKLCRNRKEAYQLSCLRHWNMIPADIQAEVWAGYREEPGGEKHMNAIKKCTEIWRERG